MKLCKNYAAAVSLVSCDRFFRVSVAVVVADLGDAMFFVLQIATAYLTYCSTD